MREGDATYFSPFGHQPYSRRVATLDALIHLPIATTESRAKFLFEPRMFICCRLTLHRVGCGLLSGCCVTTSAEFTVAAGRGLARRSLDFE